MNERETAQHFYEMLTGVFDDEQSKIVRYICFGVLFLGILMAGWYYFRAHTLADTDTPLDPDMFVDVQPRGDDSALRRIVDLAQTIDTMRGAGTSIAQTLEGMHNMPFNLDPENVMLPFGTPPSGTPSAQTPQETAPQAGPVNVKMIMTAKNGQKLAVVDAGGKKALVVKQGDELPNDGGYVRAIRDNGITVVFNQEEVKYDIAEIPKYDEFQKHGKKSQ